MTNIDVTFSLPEELVERAKSEGLLDEDRVAAWLETELTRRSRVKTLRADLEKLRAVQPGVTQEVIDAEINASREEIA